MFGLSCSVESLYIDLESFFAYFSLRVKINCAYLLERRWSFLQTVPMMGGGRGGGGGGGKVLWYIALSVWLVAGP